MPVERLLPPFRGIVQAERTDHGNGHRDLRGGYGHPEAGLVGRDPQNQGDRQEGAKDECRVPGFSAVDQAQGAEQGQEQHDRPDDRPGHILQKVGGQQIVEHGGMYFDAGKHPTHRGWAQVHESRCAEPEKNVAVFEYGRVPEHGWGTGFFPQAHFRLDDSGRAVGFVGSRRAAVAKNNPLVGIEGTAIPVDLQVTVSQ